jgi:YegS/Rv2252/BmrU family lipid kinase
LSADVVIIINPVSGPPRRGSGSDRRELAIRTLATLGVSGEVLLSTRGGHAHDLAMAATESGAELVMAWGGDGTINEVGRALVSSARAATGAQRLPALGIIPGGSGNGLARELKIPFDPALAIERAIRAPARQVDAGELGDHLFFNIGGIGLDAHVAALVSTRMHHRGLLPYIKASLGDLMRYPAADYTIEIDRKVEHVRALVVAFANSRQYGFGAQIAPAARLEDGVLDMIAIEDRALVGNLLRVPSLFVGRLDERAGVRATQMREATVRCSQPMLFHVDGEAVQGSDTLVARVHPGALRLRA